MAQNLKRFYGLLRSKFDALLFPNSVVLDFLLVVFETVSGEREYSEGIFERLSKLNDEQRGYRGRSSWLYRKRLCGD